MEAGKRSVQTSEDVLTEPDTHARAERAKRPEGGGDYKALTTDGATLARLGRPEDALSTLVRAAGMADSAGDPEGAGRAELTIVEELRGHLSVSELCEHFGRADELLRAARDPAARERLLECARHVIRAAAAAGGQAPPAPEAVSPDESWKGFSLKREVMRYEAELIGRALRDADGVVSHAAKLLGFRHHQTFVALLNNRHKGLLHARKPIVPRRRKGPRQRTAPRRAAP
jgi:hypothetical protein